MPEAARPIYAAWEFDIPGHNGDDSFELPIPATYVIDKGGIIRHSFVCMDYTQRSEPNIIIEQMKNSDYTAIQRRLTILQQHYSAHKKAAP